METLAGDWFFDVAFSIGHYCSVLLHRRNIGGKAGKFPRIYRDSHRECQSNPSIYKG